MRKIAKTKLPVEALLKAKKNIRWAVEEAEQPLLKYKNVHTVCEESRCPNRHECSAANIATFLIGGRVCTRACQFCHIATGRPQPLAGVTDSERADILEYVVKNHIRYVVITAVARDDDEEGLARHFADITRELNLAKVDVELLIPDFHARPDFLKIIGDAQPLVVAQNMETVERLTRSIRPQAGYSTTLSIFDFFKQEYPQIVLKSGFMVGLGETMSEIRQLLEDLRAHHVEVVTVGQYFQPSTGQAAVNKIYTAEEFAQIEEWITQLDFFGHETGPFIRSSYMASRTMQAVLERKKLVMS